MRGGPKNFCVDRLSDHFGQYDLILTCGSCGHERHTTPHLLALLCGWDTKLADVTSRMRCSKCGKRTCSARVSPPRAPRGYRSH